MNNKCDKCADGYLDCKCEGWIYKGNYNLFTKMLKDIAKGKIQIIEDDPTTNRRIE